MNIREMNLDMDIVHKDVIYADLLKPANFV